MTLVVREVSVRRGHRRLVDNVSLTVAPGRILALIGANGAGKSTLLHAIAGDIGVDGGDIRFDDRAIGAYPARERARRVAFLAQASSLAFPLAAREVIALARSPHAAGRAVDETIIDAAAAATDTAALLDRPYTRLSGGEKQRVQLARVFAQVWRAQDAGDRLLLLDEPVASLDIGHQSAIMHALAGLAATGVAVVLVGHDVSLAAAHADRLLALAHGRAVGYGTPSEVVTRATLSRLFDADTHVIAHPLTGTPVVLHG